MIVSVSHLKKKLGSFQLSEPQIQKLFTLYVAVLVGVLNKDGAFKTHPMNLLNERTMKGTFLSITSPGWIFR